MARRWSFRLCAAMIPPRSDLWFAQFTLHFFAITNAKSAPAAGMAGDDSAILHFMNPIARFGDRRIVRGQEERFLALAEQFSEQLKSALGIGRVEIAGRFVGENYARIVRQGAGDGHALLFAAGKMSARAAAFCPPGRLLPATLRRVRASALRKDDRACASGSSHFPGR